jgi:hypothetical protein
MQVILALALLIILASPPAVVDRALAGAPAAPAARPPAVFLTAADWPSAPRAVFPLGLPRLYCWVRNSILPPGTTAITFTWAKDQPAGIIDRFTLPRSAWAYTVAYDTAAARAAGRYDCAVAAGGKTVGIARYRVTAATATAVLAPGTSRNPPATTPVAGAFAVGDSVMLDAAAGLKSHGITVDAAVSRQFTAGTAILRQMAASGRLPGEVVVDLGTNGPFSAALFDQMMTIMRGVRRVVFVTVKVPRFWEADVNNALRAGVARWPNARLADWYAISRNQPSWFAADGFHLTPAGAAAYTQLVVDTLG